MEIKRDFRPEFLDGMDDEKYGTMTLNPKDTSSTPEVPALVRYTHIALTPIMMAEIPTDSQNPEQDAARTNGVTLGVVLQGENIDDESVTYHFGGPLKNEDIGKIAFGLLDSVLSALYDQENFATARLFLHQLADRQPKETLPAVLQQMVDDGILDEQMLRD